jgi:nicotinamidase-related amidase
MIARDRYRNALLLVDFLNLLIGEAGARLPVAALRAARHAAALKARLAGTGTPVIYANDHFGDWHSDFPSLVEACRNKKGSAGTLAQLLEPGKDDYSVLKPRHSAFYGTPLEFLLDELGIRHLIVAGMETDVCVLDTATDAYMRKIKLWVPRNCVASRSTARHAAALGLMRENLKADTRPAGPGVRLRDVFG